MATGYSDNLRANVPGPSDPVFGESADAGRGTLFHLGGSLAYSYQASRLSLSASAGTTGRYYPSAAQSLIRSTGARLSMSTPLAARTSLFARVTATHQPYSLLSTPTAVIGEDLELSESPALDLDLASTQQAYLAYAGTVGLSHRLSQRTSFQSNYAYANSDRVGAAGQMQQHSARAGLSHNLARGLSLRAGYRYGVVQYPAGPSLPHHTIDAGVDYNRTLSISRRTTLTFGTGSTAVTTSEQLRFVVLVNAALNHEIGRSWNARAAYGRHVGFDEAWEEPVLTDSVNGMLTGLITRRLHVLVSARAARGNVGLTSGGPRPATYNGAVSLQSALTRFMSVGVSYSYYHQQLGQAPALSSGFTRAADRQSVRAVANLWAPLFQRVRRGNASR